MMSERFDRAFRLASDLHRTQTRKGCGVPYISHLMSVAALVIEHGGDEDQAIAALLHDAVEDQGGLPTLERIRNEFGERVAGIVRECSDSDGGENKPAWKDRKAFYVAHIATKSDDALLVTLADKVHNARSILSDHIRIGELLWQRFTGNRDGTLWYYRSLGDCIRESRRSGSTARSLPVSSSRAVDLLPSFQARKDKAMSRMIDMIRQSAVPANLMRTAARGALALPAPEMLEILVYLSSHPIFGEQARMTLATWDEASASSTCAILRHHRRCSTTF